jgi:uncharacterized membrane protein YphA (DoxX/SURF4 family)
VASGPRSAPCWLLAAFTVTATVLGHRFWLHGNQSKMELTISIEHVTIVGCLLLLALNTIGISRERLCPPVP